MGTALTRTPVATQGEIGLREAHEALEQLGEVKARGPLLTDLNRIYNLLTRALDRLEKADAGRRGR